MTIAPTVAHDIAHRHIADRFPQLFHMTDESGLESIERHGLLSTSALLDLFQVPGDARDAVESAWRSESVTISHPLHGVVLIRDQKPMRPASLVRCLQVGLTPRDWYRLLNGKVFLWPIERRVRSLLNAQAYRDRSHLVLRIETESLPTDGEHRVWLAPIPAAQSTNPAPRGVSTFVPITAARGVRRTAEIVVDDAILDVRRHLLGIERRVGARVVEEVPLW